jgi:hypothetical protein
MALTSFESPIIILNEKLFHTLDLSEFAVTLVHELVHFLETHVLKETLTPLEPESIEEARHDFECYRALGIPIPGTHWAFNKHPDFCKSVCTPVNQGGSSTDMTGQLRA